MFAPLCVQTNIDRCVKHKSVTSVKRHVGNDQEKAQSERNSHCGFAPRTGHEFICETSHVLLAGVSGVFSPGTPVFAPPTD